jgi:hypothetical protein
MGRFDEFGVAKPHAGAWSRRMRSHYIVNAVCRGVADRIVPALHLAHEDATLQCNNHEPRKAAVIA